MPDVVIFPVLSKTGYCQADPVRYSDRRSVGSQGPPEHREKTFQNSPDGVA
jgi:hypothetical protein